MPINPALVALGGLAAYAAYSGYNKKDGQATQFDSCVVDKFLAPVYRMFAEFDSNSGITVDAIMEDHVLVNTMDKTLYCIELSGYDNYPQYLKDTFFQTLFKNFEKDPKSYFIHVAFKKKLMQRQYFFTFSNKLAKKFANEIGTNVLPGVEIVDILFDLMLQNKYFIRKKNLERGISIASKSIKRIKSEPISATFNKAIKNSIYSGLVDMELYQAYQGIDSAEESDLQQLFRLDFEGAIWTYVDFNRERVGKAINSLVTKAKWGGGVSDFKELQSAFEKKKLNMTIVNSIITMKEGADEATSVSSDIGQCNKFFYLDKKMGKRDVIRYTPLKKRDYDFNFLVKADFFSNYFGSVHKKNVKDADIYGYDKNKAFCNYSIKEENDNQNIIILAPSGSGKSVAKQKMTTLMIELDFETRIAKALGKDVLVRNFDVGKSDYPIVQLLRSEPSNKVEMLGDDMDTFAYNLVGLDATVGDAKSIKEADIQFCMDLTNLILETQGGERLTIGEGSKMREAIRHVYISGDMHRTRISFIEESHPDAYSELLSLGYQDSDRLFDVKEEKFDFFKKPVLNDIVNYISIRSENEMLTLKEREDYSSLKTKLEDIRSLKIFSGYDRVNIKLADYLYLDVNEFKESSLFVPIFFSVFQKIYLKDRRIAEKKRIRGEKMHKIFYLLEEAANFLSIKSFEDMLKKMTKEGRKYGIYLIFITQDPEDVPLEILKNISTRIFLLPAEKKYEVIDSVATKLKPTEKVVESLKRTDSHELCIWYDKGVFNLNFFFKNDIGDGRSELDLYSTTPGSN